MIGSGIFTETLYCPQCRKNVEAIITTFTDKLEFWGGPTFNTEQYAECSHCHCEDLTMPEELYEVDLTRQELRALVAMLGSSRIVDIEEGIDSRQLHRAFRKLTELEQEILHEKG